MVLDLATGTKLADPRVKVQVLGRDVAFPLILAGERAVATCEAEDTNEGAGMGAVDMSLKGRGVFERSVIA